MKVTKGEDMTYLSNINWPLLILFTLILVAVIGFGVYFFRLLIKVMKIYISKNKQI